MLNEQGYLTKIVKFVNIYDNLQFRTILNDKKLSSVQLKAFDNRSIIFTIPTFCRLKIVLNAKTR